MDEDVLLSIDSLTSRDLKIAIGEATEESLSGSEESQEPNELEEVNLESSSESNEGSEVNELEEFSSESDSSKTEISENTEITPDNDGVESLKTLLAALTDKNVAASLKGMEININITLGGK